MSNRPLPTTAITVSCALTVLLLADPAFAGEPAKPEPPTLRLPTNAIPRHYAVDLTLLPEAETFSGSVDIELAIRQSTGVLWLNGTALKIESTTLTMAGKNASARVIPGGKDFIGFAFEPPLSPGTAHLTIRYTGEVSSIETSGLFRERDGAHWYLYSQFEAIDARRAFPCFDEPTYKTPWDLTLHIPQEDIAVANTPQIADSAEPNHLKKVVFATTKPLPSYLVALGVGPFDIVDAGRAGQNKIPIRIVVPQGHAKEAWYAVETYGPVLDLLERYVGQPYPYEKLDNLVAPQTQGFSAMENAGLITSASNVLLVKPEDATQGFRHRCVSTYAHEAAHQWFGDLVTPVWWDDAWLNESFASWLGTKITDQYRPDWSHGVDPILARSRAAQADTLVSARQIRQPIESNHDIENAFDGITYAKGQAVLQMFEAWVGDSRFRSGIQHYLRAHAYGNATAYDFVDALAAEAGAALRPAFLSFINQPGIPDVKFERSCAAGHTVLDLWQSRYLPLGASGAATERWQLPVCVRYGSGETGTRLCTLLDGERASLPLPGSTCSTWILGNAGGLGYYRSDYQGELLTHLVEDTSHLTVPERVATLNDAVALVQDGALPLKRALELVRHEAADPDGRIVQGTLEIVSLIRDHLVPDSLRAKYQHFIETTYGKRARALGLTPLAGEDDETTALRGSLVPFVAEEARDPEILQQASALAHRWLEDHHSISPESAGIALHLAALKGNQSLFDDFHSAALKATTRRDRTLLLQALGSFSDPKLAAQAEALILNGEFDVRDSLGAILNTRTGSPVIREQRYVFIKNNFAAVAAKLPRDAPARFPGYARSFCDDEHRRDVTGFFEKTIANYSGGPRLLNQVVEQISLCIAFKKTQADGLEEFLAER